MKPELIVTDEPVSMIDVFLRASILDLMLKLKRDLNITYIFITRELVAVMYLGKIVEYAEVDKIFEICFTPVHKSAHGINHHPQAAKRGKP